MVGGYFCVPRGWRQDPVFRDEPATEREAWIWLLEEAAFAPHEKRVGAVIVRLQRGQVAASTRFLAGAWGWTDSRVRRFLTRLRNRRSVDALTDAGVTVISICNYDEIQNATEQTDAAPDAEPTRDRRSGDANDKKGIRKTENHPATPRKRGRAPRVAEDADHARWRARVLRFDDCGAWDDRWGPRPDQIGCEAADDVIADFYERRRNRSPHQQLYDAGKEVARRLGGSDRTDSVPATLDLIGTPAPTSAAPVVPLAPQAGERSTAPVQPSITRRRAS